MAEALLYNRLEGQRVRCNVCLWRCRINPGKTGVCGVGAMKTGPCSRSIMPGSLR